MINQMALVQAQPGFIYVENYEVGDTILPKHEGQYKVFSITPLFTKDDKQVTFGQSAAPGTIATSSIEVIWTAADDVAASVTTKMYNDTVAEMQRQQRTGIVTPEKPKLII